MDHIAGFLAVAAMMAALAIAFVLPAMLRRAPRSDALVHATANAAIHASELTVLDQELASGAIPLADHAAARDDILRRVLAESAEQATPVVDRA
ncbi:MAG TPA: c-type cytochrome biogenesis protein CcmI, partial [Burkholderiales bacterium]